MKNLMKRFALIMMFVAASMMATGCMVRNPHKPTVLDCVSGSKATKTADGGDMSATSGCEEKPNPAYTAFDQRNSLSTGAKAGIGVGVGAAILGTVGLILGLALSSGDSKQTNTVNIHGPGR